MLYSSNPVVLKEIHIYMYLFCGRPCQMPVDGADVNFFSKHDAFNLPLNVSFLWEDLSSYGDLIKNWSANSDRVESYVSMEENKSSSYDHLLMLLCFITSFESFFHMGLLTKIVIAISFASLPVRQTMIRKFREIGEYPLLLSSLVFLLSPVPTNYFIEWAI